MINRELKNSVKAVADLIERARLEADISNSELLSQMLLVIDRLSNIQTDIQNRLNDIERKLDRIPTDRTP